MKRMSRIELAIFALVWAGVLVFVVGRVSGAEPVKFTATVDGTSVKVAPVLPAGTGAIWYRSAYADGKFTGILITASGSVPSIYDVQIVVTTGNTPTPPPVPPVPPTPDPPVPPVPTVLWAIVIEESKERTPAQAAVLLSPRTVALFKASGGQFRIVDAWDDAGKRRDVGAEMKPYADRADVTKVKPLLFIVSPDGVVYFEGKLPAKVEDVEAIVAKIKKGGKP